VVRKTVSTATIVVMLTASTIPAFAKSVCYGPSDPMDLGAPIIRISVGQARTLKTRKEAEKWGDSNPVQRTYLVHGIHTLWNQEADYYMGTVDGSVTVARGMGARMGLTYAGNSADPYVVDRIVQYACVSDEPSPTPETWSCQYSVLNRQNPKWEPLELGRRDPMITGLCSVFSLRFHTPPQ
jgi:hypothetical protein